MQPPPLHVVRICLSDILIPTATAFVVLLCMLRDWFLSTWPIRVVCTIWNLVVCMHEPCLNNIDTNDLDPHFVHIGTIGDDHTQGTTFSCSWVERLAERMPDTARYHNFGRTGTTSNYWRHRVPRLALEPLQAVVLAIGTTDILCDLSPLHRYTVDLVPDGTVASPCPERIPLPLASTSFDAACPHSSYHRVPSPPDETDISVATYRDNMACILDHLCTHYPRMSIVLCTLPPITEDEHSVENQRVCAYNQVLHALAREYRQRVHLCHVNRAIWSLIASQRCQSRPIVKTTPCRDMVPRSSTLTQASRCLTYMVLHFWDPTGSLLTSYQRTCVLMQDCHLNRRGAHCVQHALFPVVLRLMTDSRAASAAMTTSIQSTVSHTVEKKDAHDT